MEMAEVGKQPTEEDVSVGENRGDGDDWQCSKCKEVCLMGSYEKMKDSKGKKVKKSAEENLICWSVVCVLNGYVGLVQNLT